MSALTAIDPAGLAADRDMVWIAPKSRDVALHPGKRGRLIEQAVIAGRMMRRAGGQFGKRKEAENAKPVVHRHHDDTSRGQRRAVIALFRTIARHEAAAIDIDQHRQFALRRPIEVRRRPDIQVKAVLARGRRAEHHVRVERLLHTSRGEFRRLADA